MEKETKKNPAYPFSDSAKEVISYSRDEAFRIGNDFIGTEHLILAILRQNDNVGKYILKYSVEKIDQLKADVERSVGKKSKASTKNLVTLPLTKQAEIVIRSSLAEAKKHNAKIVDSGCMLLAILQDKATNACQTLEKYGLDYEKASLLYFQTQSTEKETKESTDQSTQNNIKDTATDSQVRQLLDRIIHVSIKNSIDGVLDIENESSEVASLLASLDLDQGMMFGLFGQWGRGKTFFWKNIWKNLSKNVNNPFYKVEFHAWKYQDTPATWAYLYEALVKEFYKKPRNIFSYKWIGYWLRIFRLNINRKGTIPVLKFLVVIGIGTLVFLTIKEIGEEIEKVNFIASYIGLPASLILTVYNLLIYFKKEYSTSAKDIFIKYSEKYSLKQHLGIQAEIQKELSILFKVWIPKRKVGKKRVLIFIDDIDRCNESKIIQIIDSLRIMLDENEIAERCVILAAIDERILKIAISTKYYELVAKDFNSNGEKKISLEKLVREYMDKLFIGGFKLKTLNQTERKDILQSLTKGKIHSLTEESKTVKKSSSSVGEKNKQDKQEKLNTTHSDINANSTILRTGSSEESFELEDFEYAYLQDVLVSCDAITPRVIRIFYYRYLLAKRFLYIKISQDHELYAKWNNSAIDKSILPYLIMFFTVNVSPEEISSSYFLWSNNSSESNDLSEFTFVLLNKTFLINGDLLKQLLEIIEITVPY